MALCRRFYPAVVAAVLNIELDSWATFGYRLGGHATYLRLLVHLEALERKAAVPLPPDDGVVHRAEVEE
jgi:hypothetical protein